MIKALLAISLALSTLIAPIPAPEEPLPEGCNYLERDGVIEPEPDEPEMTYIGTYYITGYDICVKCCGKVDGITASGVQATVGRTIATGREFDFGTRLYIDGIGERVVEDRGVKNGCIDVLCGDHPECYAITGHYDVYLIND